MNRSFIKATNFSRLLFIFLLSIANTHILAFERIVSINLCTDQMLYLLEKPENIASVSFLAKDPNYSYLSQELSQFDSNDARVEEIIKYNPDLILAGKYTDKPTIHLLQSLGYRVEKIDVPQDWNHIEQGILHLGNILQKEERAEAIVAEMKARKEKALNKVANFTTQPLAVILAPGGFTHGKFTMNSETLALAGYRNLAEQAGLVGSGTLSLEQLIASQPDYIIIEDATPNRNSLAQRLLNHTAIKQGLTDIEHIFIHPNLWTCGGPSMIIALEKLVEAHP